MNKIKTVLSASLLFVGCLLAILSVEAQEAAKPKSMDMADNNLKIEIYDTHMWRSWFGHIVAHPTQGKDGGSPLMVFSSFSFDNSKGNSKQIHWEAWLSLDKSEEVFPIEIWDSNSILPWNGKLEAGEIKKVTLVTRSGPYLRPGDKAILFTDFFFNGKRAQIKSKLIEIERTD